MLFVRSDQIEMSMSISERYILQEFVGVKFAQEFRTTLLNWRAINSGPKWKFIENLGSGHIYKHSARMYRSQDLPKRAIAVRNYPKTWCTLFPLTQCFVL